MRQKSSSLLDMCALCFISHINESRLSLKTALNRFSDKLGLCLRFSRSSTVGMFLGGWPHNLELIVKRILPVNVVIVSDFFNKLGLLMVFTMFYIKRVLLSRLSSGTRCSGSNTRNWLCRLSGW